MPERIPLTDVLGLRPVGKRLREIRLGLRGDALTPKSRFDASSLRILDPALAFPLWLGRIPQDRRTPIYNLYNHAQTPIEEGWSVRKTQVRDFRGGSLTYDSHNGTDFAVPPGTVVVAAAPARVVRISDEFNRGGLKVMLDHGDGLVTTSNHLARALVRVGDEVGRGEPVALSGASGMDFLFTFGCSAPHVHFNVWLDGRPVDPFARLGEVSLWRRHNDPVPCAAPAPPSGEEAAPPSVFSAERVAEALSACRDDALRERIAGIVDPELRAFELMFHLNYYPTRFERQVPLYAAEHPRAPRLDLPFRAEDYVGIRLDA